MTQISLGDIVELMMAIENHRPIPDFTSNRIYYVLNTIKVGDIIKITDEVPIKEHYGISD